MNKLKQIILAVAVALASLSCQDRLDVETGSEVPTDKLYETVNSAWAAMDGIYRALAAPGWTVGNLEQAFGLMSNQLAADLMGEDMVQREQGNGWFYYHYTYKIREYYRFNGWTSYEIWNMWYTAISQANEILAYAPAAKGDEAERNSLLAQAYAMRSFAYFNLIRWFQRTYVGHEDDPGVPVYITPTTSEQQGKPRGTVENVYEQINADLDSALILFDKAVPQKHKSHIDRYIALGIRSRVALVQENWELAAASARDAREKEGLQLMSVTDLMGGFNTIANPEWMWGAEIGSTQTSGYATLWAHMDARLPMHAQTARKIASKWLYEMIPLPDARRNWFRDPATVPDDEERLAPPGPDVRYNQQKFYVKSVSSLTGDYLYMRGAEMFLNEAEARCRLGEYGRARDLLLELIGYKNETYAELLPYIPDGNVQTLLSTESNSIRNLLDEILLQRRIELWGEGFRMFDVIRLKSGFSRNYTGTNHPYPLKLKPDSWKFVLLLPQAEFDSNSMLDANDDQTPLE